MPPVATILAAVSTLLVRAAFARGNATACVGGAGARVFTSLFTEAGSATADEAVCATGLEAGGVIVIVGCCRGGSALGSGSFRNGSAFAGSSIFGDDSAFGGGSGWGFIPAKV